MRSKNIKIDRRTFLKTTGVGGVSLALTAGLGEKVLGAETKKDNSSKKMPTRILGKTGVSVSILGLGGGVDPSAYMNLMRVGLNMGINYWDSANIYGNGKNEETIGQFYGKYPEDRKKVFQVTKASMVTEPKGMSEQLDLSLKRMQTDYIDLYFMHGLDNPERLTPEIKAWAEQRKKEGKIRFFGFSCHANMAKMLMHASTLGWIDAVMATYNYQLINNDDMKKAIDACTSANIGLIAMKTQGQLFGMPQEMPADQGERGDGSRGRGGAGEAMGPPPVTGTQGSGSGQDDISALSHFIEKGYTLQQARLKAVWEDKRISVCLSEMSNLTMLKDNVAAAADGVELSREDREILQQHAHNNRSLYCQACTRCESAMGFECRIPDVLRYMMYYHSYGKTDDARRFFRELPENVRMGLASRDYSKAEEVCPNGIQIDRAMKEAALILA